MEKVIGTNVQCGVWENGEFVPFGFSRSCNVSASREMIKVASRTSGQSDEYIPGRKSWSMSCNCLLSTDEQKVWNLYNHGTKVKVSFQIMSKDGTGATTLTGDAYIKSIQAGATIHDMASFDIDLQGSGALTYAENEVVVLNVGAVLRDGNLQMTVMCEQPEEGTPCAITLHYERLLDNFDIVVPVGSTSYGYTHASASWNSDYLTVKSAASGYQVQLVKR